MGRGTVYGQSAVNPPNLLEDFFTDPVVTIREVSSEEFFTDMVEMTASSHSSGDVNKDVPPWAWGGCI